MQRKIKFSRYAREIKIKGQFRGETDEIRTRMTRGEYEKRADIFDTLQSDELGGYEYRDFVEWGGENTGASRPQIYENEAEKQKAYRIRKKIEEGRPLRPEDREFLRSINKDAYSEI